MEEQWLPIKGYEGIYEISNLGRVKSIKRKFIICDKILSPGATGTNLKYLGVGLRKNNAYKNFLVHRLVAIHFIGLPINSKYEVNHIDFNSFNNHVDNLEWVTSSENSKHSRLHYSEAKKGEKHPASKVTDIQAIEIKRMRKNKIRCKIIAKEFGITVQDVQNISTRYYSHVNHLV